MNRSTFKQSSNVNSNVLQVPVNIPISKVKNATKMSASHYDIKTVSDLDQNIVEKIEKVKVEMTKLEQAQHDAKTKLAEELAAKKEKDELLKQAKIKEAEEVAAKKDKETAEFRVKKFQEDHQKEKDQKEKDQNQKPKEEPKVAAPSVIDHDKELTVGEN